MPKPSLPRICLASCWDAHLLHPYPILPGKDETPGGDTWPGDLGHRADHSGLHHPTSPSRKLSEHGTQHGCPEVRHCTGGSSIGHGWPGTHTVLSGCQANPRVKLKPRNRTSWEEGGGQPPCEGECRLLEPMRREPGEPGRETPPRLSGLCPLGCHTKVGMGGGTAGLTTISSVLTTSTLPKWELTFP